MYNNEKELQKEVDLLTKENSKLKLQLSDAEYINTKIKDDMDLQTTNHEVEVQLRLQFEAKLNSLHALHRDLAAKYNRATEDILNLEILNRDQSAQIELQKTELIDLRAKRIEYEAKI